MQKNVKLSLPPNSREAALDKLLDNYTDFGAAPACMRLDGSRSGKPGSREPRMPETWVDVFRELDRALTRMAVLVGIAGQVRPRYRRRFEHLRSWYFQVDRQRVPVMRTAKRGGTFQATGPTGELLFRVELNRIGDPELVAEALTWLGLEYVGDPSLPKELRAA